ncbi:MAG: CDP-diacylglycerol--glycerol-3-phosphate 3-phosphatidyltransferase [Lachnospiraceae bacterium]|nr:CDP-diacylglycerol--glycerol-3-phosphate 3-phosphatidyltransferase [Lachnospiraceae bacterium]
MNLPNKITLARVFMIPLFVVLLLIDFKYNNIFACAVFCIACISDYFDGKLARKYNLVSNFGKFADPLADKLLVGAALICFVELDLLSAWMVILIISREFIISGVRLIAADNGVVIAASMWGKVKTTFQMIMSIYLLLFAKVYHQADFPFHTIMVVLGEILKYVAVALTIISLIDYMYKNRELFSDIKD